MEETEMSPPQSTAGAPATDAEGFLLDHHQWSEQLAHEIARENGIADLSERHWKVIKFMRSSYIETGSAPSIRSLGKLSGVPVRELYELFPKGPAKLAAKIAGIPKPRGCI
jgi:TusE/DsrC/DsvC family sulfur relay protein